MDVVVTDIVRDLASMAADQDIAPKLVADQDHQHVVAQDRRTVAQEPDQDRHSP